jgi:hypothetical protein
MRGGFRRYIGPGPGKPRRAMWISEEPHSLSHRRFILMFSLYVQLFLVYLEKLLSKIHWWKVTSGFIEPQTLNFQRDVATCPGVPKQSCSALQNFSWRTWNVATYKLFHILSEYDILSWFPMETEHPQWLVTMHMCLHCNTSCVREFIV